MRSSLEVVRAEKVVVGKKKKNQSNAYMRCHPMKKRSADANFLRTDSALPLCIAISIRCLKKSKPWITGIHSQATT